MTQDFDNELKAILAELENPDILLAVSLDLQEQDRQNGTHTYEAFKSSIIALEPGFRPRFTEAETRAMLALGTDKLKNSISTGKVIRQATDDGFMLKASLDGTDRAISRLGSKYALSSSIEARAALEEVQGIDKILRENLKPLVDDLQVIRSRLDETHTQDKDFYTFKREFQTLHSDLYTQCGLDGTNSFEEARMLISKHEILLQEKIDNLEETAAEAKALLIAEIKARAEKKDTIRKETLKFFAEIGFDMFSKAETDAVFERLNSNPAIWGSLGINAKFDIENGVLGYEGAFSDGGSLSLQEKTVVAKVFNKMLTGSTDYPVSFDGMGNCIFYPSLSAADEQRFDPMFDMKFFGNQML